MVAFDRQGTVIIALAFLEEASSIATKDSPVVASAPFIMEGNLC